MINLQKIFDNHKLFQLPVCYKEATYRALLTFLKQNGESNKNLQSLDQLLKIDLSRDLSHELSTFFHYVVRQRASTTDINKELEYDFLLFAFALDSLFLLVKENSSFPIQCPLEATLLLPITGANLSLSQEVNGIFKRENCIILKKASGEELIYEFNQKNKVAKDIALLNLTEENYIYKNIINLHAHYDALRSDNFDTFFSKLTQAIFKLKEIDEGFIYHLNHIEAIIPMAFVSNDITKSFTLSNIPHLIFLSDCNSIAKLMENLIHEALHDELNIFMNYYDLILSKNQCYYSPWREDARPIRGLLHAIYVFTGIFAFYHALLSNKQHFLTDEEKKFVIFRYSLIYYELGLAFYQLKQDPSELTELGSFFIQRLHSIYISHGSGFIYQTCPPGILMHIEAWRKSNTTHNVHIPNNDFWSYQDGIKTVEFF